MVEIKEVWLSKLRRCGGRVKEVWGSSLRRCGGRN